MNVVLYPTGEDDTGNCNWYGKVSIFIPRFLHCSVGCPVHPFLKVPHEQIIIVSDMQNLNLKNKGNEEALKYIEHIF